MDNKKEPILAKLFRKIWRASGYKYKADVLLTRFLWYRMRYLKESNLNIKYPSLHDVHINHPDMPLEMKGTPQNEIEIITKLAKTFDRKKILEIGSANGGTACYLSENTGDGALIYTVDIDPNHGSAYRGKNWEKKIIKIIGTIDHPEVALYAPYDFIFIDAAHNKENVLFDSRMVFKLMSESAIVLWHDYAPITYFAGDFGVPEALNELKNEGYPIEKIRGTTLAILSMVHSDNI